MNNQYLLVAKVIARLVENKLPEDGESGLLRLDGLNGDCLAMAVNQIGRESWSSSIYFMIPENLVDVESIEYKDHLIAQNAAFARNARIPEGKTLTLTANSAEDSSLDTLKDVDAINAGDVVSAYKEWSGLTGLDNEERRVFDSILKASIDSLKPTMIQVENFVDSVRNLSVNKRCSLVDAVSSSLPSFGLPVCVSDVRALLESKKKLSKRRQWAQYFKKASEERELIFLKDKRPTELTNELLTERWNQLLKESGGEVDAEFQEMFEAHIHSDVEDSLHDLIEFDWYGHKLNELLSLKKESRTKKQSLAERTRELFESRFNSEFERNQKVITEALEALENLDLKHEDSVPDSLYQFYAEYQDHIISEKSLAKDWEKLLYSKNIACTDFVSGLVVAVSRLKAHCGEGKDALFIEFSGSANDLYENKNKYAVRTFGNLYRGLNNLKEGLVRFAMTKTKSSGDLLFDYAKLKAYCKRASACTKNAKENCTLKFKVRLEDSTKIADETFKAETPQSEAITIEWRYCRNSVAEILANDFDKLRRSLGKNGENSPLLCFNFTQGADSVNSKGAEALVTLLNSDSLGLEGRSYSLLNDDYSQDVRRILDDSISKSRIRLPNPDEVRSMLDDFYHCYSSAVQAFLDKGLAASEIRQAYDSYCGLARYVISISSDTAARKLLHALITCIGVYSFRNHSSNYAIVAPWHPLRMFALHCQFMRRIAVIERSLRREFGAVLDEKTEFFGWISAENQLRMDPEVVLCPSDKDPKTSDIGGNFGWKLLKECEALYGYSLYGNPGFEEGVGVHQIGSPKESATELVDAVVDYLKLMPYEKDNIVIGLPDAAGSELPLMVVDGLNDKLQKLSEHDSIFNNFRFTLQVGSYSSKDEDKIADHLAKINKDSIKNQVISDSSFLTDSLRSNIAIQVMSNRVDDSKRHLSLIHRLVRSESLLRWVSVPVLEYDPFRIDQIPSLESRRYFNYLEAQKAYTFLVDQRLTRGGALYIRLLSGLEHNSSWELEDIKENPERIKLPVLVVAMDDNRSLAEAIQDIHRNSDWVVISDDLIDRRQLLNQEIKIVRYKKDNTTGRTQLISSKDSMNSLSSLIERELAGYSINGREGKAADGMLNRSYDVSGYIALRAARRSANSGELIGICLSQYLVRKEIQRICNKKNENVLINAAYLIDDYSSWFKSDGKIADLLCVAVTEKDSELKVHIYVTESKYCSESTSSVERSKSFDQLRTSMRTLLNAFSTREYSAYDVPIWLNRLADLVLDTSSVSRSAGVDSKRVAEICEQIRNGDFDLSINGYSHVFVHDDFESFNGLRKDEFFPLSGDECSEVPDMCQEVYTRGEIGRLLLWFSDEPDGDLLGNLDSAEKIVELREKMSGDALSMKFRGVNFKRSSEGSSILACGAEPVDAEGLVSKGPSNPELPFIWESSINEDEDLDYSEEDSFVPSEKYELLNADESSSDVQTEAEDTASESDRDAVCTTPSHDWSPIGGGGMYAPGFDKIIQSKKLSSGYSAERIKWGQDVGVRLSGKLRSYGVAARVLSTQLTPNGCLVKFKGEDKLNQAFIEKHTDAILSTTGLKITFCKSVPMGFNVFVASEKRESVTIWNMWNNREVQRKGGVNLKFLVGLDEETNSTVYVELNTDPHSIIFGGTGSGKSVFVKMLLLDMAATNSSKKLQIVLINPKKVGDYQALAGLPHMVRKEIRERTEAEEFIEELLDEMNARATKLGDAGFSHYRDYNEKHPEDAIPAIVVVHEELPAWTMMHPEYKKFLQTKMTPIITQSRALGIYVIFVAQRPDKNVFVEQIRSNCGNRIGFKVAKEEDSIIGLGYSGAEKLLGYGHLSFKERFAQAPYVVGDEDDEFKKIVSMIAQTDFEWND